MTPTVRLALTSCALLVACAATPSPGGTPDASRTDAHRDAHADVRVTHDAHGPDASDGAPSVACTLTPPTPPSSRLVTDGELLKDALGRTVFLRGVDAGGRSKFAPYVPFDFADGGFSPALEAYMSHAESWGIDAMRVPFTWAALEPTEGTNDTAWMAMYEQIVASAWSHGIWSVVDFHQDVYSEVYCGDGFPGWTVTDAGPPAHDCPGWQLEYATDTSVQHAFDVFWGNATGLQAKYLDVWGTMIPALADTPGVLGFEIINEPASGSANNLTFGATTLTAFHTMVAAYMRNLAPSSLIFVDPTGVDGVTATTGLTNPGGGNLVFSPHYYPIVHGDTASLVTGLQGWADIGKSWNVPVFLGEFGAANNDPTTPAYMASMWSAVDELGFAGATEWEYSISTELWNSEMNTLVTPDGGEYPVAQSIIRPYARAVAGTAITQGWDGAKTTFTLSFTPASGGTDITEVRVPARAYRASYHVRAVGACFDATSAKGELLLQPVAGAKTVSVTVTP